ncbi:MAG: hypothetical protein OHK0039_29250 [Bacteroidia bacterium]
MRYLDPKNDLTFKKIFGQHPEILIDLLNNLLPLEPGRRIEQVEYLTPEQVPEIPLFKNSVVDVKCFDQYRRTFIVEMQLLWTDSFMSRVVFNASKAYVRQLERGKKYESLQPVYALSLVDEVFHPSAEYYHRYQIARAEDPRDLLEDLTFVFVELPKIGPHNLPPELDKALWLRFFTEIKDGDETPPAGLEQNEQIRQALQSLQESAFTQAELEYYDQYWDSVSRERSIRIDAEAKGLKEGIEQGIEQGAEQEKHKRILKAIARGRLSLEEIAEDFEVSPDYVRSLVGEG